MQYAILVLFVVIVIGGAIYFAPKGWRTVAANVAMSGLVALGAMLDFAAGFDWREVLPPDVAPWVIVTITILNIGLRAVSNTNIGSKTQP